MKEIRKLKGKVSYEQLQFKLNELIEWTKHIEDRFNKIEIDISNLKV